jgi:prefoldin subunit 5
VLDADAVSREMHDRVRRDAALLRTAVRRFLARGRIARLIACLVVGFAAVVWIAVASVVLRVLFIAVLVLIVFSCVWLMVGIWVGRPEDGEEEFGRSAWRVAARWVRRAVARAEDEPVGTAVASHEPARDDQELGRRERELVEREAEFAAARSSVDAAIADLLRREERLHTDAEQLHQKLADQIEAMRAVVARMAQLEQEVSSSAHVGNQPVQIHAVRTQLKSVDAEPEPAEAGEYTELDRHAARLEVEFDLRLEKIEEQEEMLRELEEQLRRREHQLADFVAQTQRQLSPAQ